MRVAGLVDDGLEELVPGLRGRREARDAVKEPELIELLRTGHVDHIRLRHGDHDTKVRSATGAIGCGGVERMLRLRTGRNPREAE